jgi:hypothetical protein
MTHNQKRMGHSTYTNITELLTKVLCEHNYYCQSLQLVLGIIYVF